MRKISSGEGSQTGWHTQIKGYHNVRGREPLRAWIQFPAQVRALLGLRPGLRCKVIACEGKLVLKPKQAASAVHPIFKKMQGAERVRFERAWHRMLMRLGRGPKLRH
ncbi:hypothetical protein [Curvibacter delicatus]|jgi:bifunctional DNA-binding transcriptional regulator/antitoxin component of YhaV-PrlF toxin-antitoxin module|uniref:hypothetical protein n=1 Tax=Curvibacter delicatus TaxID=80879 RepID=UPI00082C5BD0|nr:hypothetical protein [Curvibacter delicatus]